MYTALDSVCNHANHAGEPFRRFFRPVRKFVVVPVRFGEFASSIVREKDVILDVRSAFFRSRSIIYLGRILR